LRRFQFTNFLSWFLIANLIVFLFFFLLVDGYCHVLNIYHYSCKGWLWRKYYLAFKFSLCNTFLKVPFCKFYFFENQNGLCFESWIWALILDYMTFPFYILNFKASASTKKLSLSLQLLLSCNLCGHFL
jgi:hypothetical protein